VARSVYDQENQKGIASSRYPSPLVFYRFFDWLQFIVVMRSDTWASHDGSHVGWHLACSNKGPCSYQREDKHSSGDHKGEMHPRDECLSSCLLRGCRDHSLSARTSMAMLTAVIALGHPA
jgi:hypothetical protein